MAPFMVNLTGIMSSLEIPIAKTDRSGTIELWQPESAIMGIVIGVRDEDLLIGYPKSAWSLVKGVSFTVKTGWGLDGRATHFPS